MSTDPLDVSALAYSFDKLTLDIQKETEKLATQVYVHIEEKNKQSTLNISQINENLKSIQKLLDKLTSLNLEIDKLQQLQLFTRDFNQRLVKIKDNLKN